MLRLVAPLVTRMEEYAVPLFQVKIVWFENLYSNTKLYDSKDERWGLKKKIEREGDLSCNSKNVVYIIKCTSCNEIYIDCTQALNNRVSLHKSNIEYQKIGNFMYQNTFICAAREI